MIKPRLQEVADEAGVSLTTASLALSGKGKISLPVRKRVQDAAASLGYAGRGPRPAERPNPPHTITILLPVDDVWAPTFHFVRPIIMEIERSLIRENYYPVVIPTFYTPDEEKIVSKILANEAKAVFSIHYGNAALFQKLEGMGIPVVVINNNNFQDQFYSVCIDDFQGAYEGCLHLIRLGHREIGYIDYPRPDLPAVVVDRFIGFKKAIDEYAISWREERRITTALHDRAALRDALARLFGGPSKPTALFAHDDHFASRVLAELQAMGLSVPRDVSLIAPGDVINYDEPFAPRITTMRTNTVLLGQISGDLMMNRLRRRPEDIHVLKVKQQLVDRGSCRQI
jgi:LacI family transcriptional regulator